MTVMMEAIFSVSTHRILAPNENRLRERLVFAIFR